MPIPTPQDYTGKRVLQQPYDENGKPIPTLFAAITDPGTGLIVGYLPIKATDNGDGTATIKVDTEIALDGSVTVNDVKVGSSDGQTSGNKWLKVLADGTLIIDKTGLATELKQDATNTKLDAVITQLDVTLSSRASEATLLAANVTLGNILAALTGLATEATLSTRASEATLITLLTTAAFQARINTLGQKAMAASTPVVLPSDQSPLDVNVISTPGGEAADAGQLFATATPVINLASAGTEQAYLLIRNPAASGKEIRIKRFVLSAMTLNKAVAYFIYFNPTVTANGTVVTRFSTTAGSLAVPVALINTQPTVTAFGSRVISSSASNGSTVILDEEFAIRLPANTSLLITVIPQTTNTDTTLAALWSEV